MAVLTEEQEMLKDAASAWAQERSPISAYRKLRNSGAPLATIPRSFADMAEMGWAGIIVPEEFGGADFGYLSMGVVLEQLGRTLTASPLVTSSLAVVSGLRLAGSAAQKEEWLPRDRRRRSRRDSGARRRRAARSPGRGAEREESEGRLAARRREAPGAAWDERRSGGGCGADIRRAR